MFNVDEEEIVEYIRAKLFDEDSVFLEYELVLKVLNYEVDYLVEIGAVYIDEDDE